MNVHNYFLLIFNAREGVTTLYSNDSYNCKKASWYVALLPSSCADDLNFRLPIGQPTFIVESSNKFQMMQVVFDLYYQFTTTDNVTVTPSIQCVSRPYDEDSKILTGKNECNALIFMLKTSFVF